MAATKISALGSASALVDSDLAVLVNGGVNKKITLAALAATLAGMGAGRWTDVFSSITPTPSTDKYAAGSFSATNAWGALTAYVVGDVVRPSVANGFVYVCTAAGTSDAAEPTWSTTQGAATTDATVTWRTRGLNVIATTADLSATARKGVPLRYAYNGTTYYGMVIGASATRLAIAGAPLSSGYALTALSVGRPEMLLEKTLHVSGVFAAGTGDLTLFEPLRWQQGKARLVHFWGIEGGLDTGTEPKINVKCNGSLVSRNDADAGITLDSIWVEHPAGQIHPTQYAIDYDQDVVLRVTAAGGVGDAADLTVRLAFVLE